MNKSETEKIKQQLLHLKSELQALETAYNEASGPVVLDQSRVGRVSRMDALQTQQMELETSRRRQQQLMKIEGALSRLESGDYGACFICGEEIDIRRLSIDPMNTRCMICADK